MKKLFTKLAALFLAVLFCFSPLSGVAYSFSPISETKEEQSTSVLDPIFTGELVQNTDGNACENEGHTYDNEIDTDCNVCGEKRTLPYDTYGTTGDCYWYCKDQNLTIAGNGKMADYSANVSSLPWGMQVKTVTIEDGVTGIGSYAFYQLLDLNKVTIPDSVTTIGHGAFSYCLALDSLALPKNLTAIGNSAFNTCVKLESLTLPETVKTIGNSAFYGCKNLENVNIPEGITAIEFSTFYNCNELNEIKIPKSVKSIGYSAFYNCFELENIVLPEGIPAIEESTFYGCQSLTAIVIPQSVESIGMSAFDGCSELSSLELSKSVKSIGQFAFAGTKLSAVFYGGSAKDRENITIAYGNDPLTLAVWSYKRCEDLGGHIYDNDCDATCNNCDFTRTPSDHVYDNIFDPDCNECGKTRDVPKKGDVNEDGKVDKLDFDLLQQYINDWDVKVNLETCDFNLDGKVNNKDLGLIQQAILAGENPDDGEDKPGTPSSPELPEDPLN